MYEHQQGRWVTPNGNPVTFEYRADTSDWNTINACLGFHDEYKLRDHPIVGDAIDIGGYLGSVGVTIAVDNPEAKVLIVEPVPWNVRLIEANAALNNVSDRVTVFHGAAGPKGETTSEIRFGYRGDANLEHHAFVGNSSLSYDTGGDTPHDTLDVPTLGLAALLAKFAITEPAFMKIDCEGGEWPFFDVSKAVLSKLPYIIGEAHAVRGHTAKDIVTVLGKTHEVTLAGDPDGTCEFIAVRR